MTVKESDDKIQMITKLLEKGGTMLATHHDCGAPMFRYQGKVICPVCDFQEKRQKQPEESKKQGNNLDRQQIVQSQQGSGYTEISENSSLPVLHISNIIAKKIQNLTTNLETETELGRIKEKLECIELGVRILKILREND